MYMNDEAEVRSEFEGERLKCLARRLSMTPELHAEMVACECRRQQILQDLIGGKVVEDAVGAGVVFSRMPLPVKVSDKTYTGHSTMDFEWVCPTCQSVNHGSDFPGEHGLLDDYCDFCCQVVVVDL